MRLDKIVLNGFKSFAEKTEFTFDSSVTAIVGPNGCGKSNVVDAIKWVMGEQSTKSLRSNRMADVIFSGSRTRKPLGAAEVTLVISNTKGELPIDTEQVQISRKIYKSGESEYRINNKISRLKDIREMFLDTGMGAKAYSIIEQGQVEQLVTSSKQDRRSIFEEAAGISKYKVHKEQALRKLERTEQNLLRVADIVSEVQKRLRSVKLQAGKARSYLRYSDRLKELRVNYSLVEYDKIKTARDEKTEAMEEIQENYEAVSTEVSRNDTLISELGSEILEKENEINRADNELVEARSKIDQHLQRIDFLRIRTEELQERKVSAGRQVEELKQQRKKQQSDLERYRTERHRCDRQLEEKRSRLEELQEDIRQINSSCASLEAELEDEKSGIIDIVRRTAQLHNEVESMSVYKDNLSNQKNQLANRAKTSQEELEDILTEKARHNARLEDVESLLDELREKLQAKRNQSDQVEGEVAEQEKLLASRKEAKSALSSEHSVLADMERRREGLNIAVKTILRDREERFDYVEGILADIVRADAEYATAVEAGLEGRTDALVVSNTDRLLAERGKIEELDGRVNFISADKNGHFSDSLDLGNIDSAIGRVVEVVDCDSKYAPLVWKLLGKTIIVESVSAAMELAAQLGSEYQFVTLQGESVSSEGMINLGPLGRKSGLISRKSRMHQLREAIDAANSEIAEIEEQLRYKKQSREYIEKVCSELRTAIYETNTEKMQLDSKLDALARDVKRLGKEQPLINGEMDRIEEQINQAVQKKYNSRQKLQELQDVNNQRQEHIEELQERFEEKKERQRQQQAELTDLKVSLGQIAEQSRSLEKTLSALESQLASSSRSMESAKSEQENCAKHIRQAQRDILNSETAVSSLFMEKEQKQNRSRQLHEQVRELTERQQEIEQLIRDKRSEEEEIKEKIDDLKIKLSQLEVKEQDLTERVNDDLHIDLIKAYEDYTRSEDVDWAAVKEEMNELRGKIDRLGNVNLDAIAEQEELEKRNGFLTDQVEDLNKSKHQLQQLVNRLNKKSREKFTRTFEEIRGHFHEIFRKLFGGGKADILLEEDAEDILEAGIDIIARPPGKESRGISLLSGGEKTMTAIALLFAVFKTKPSPFCLLDEVDAALDEANNERFNLLLQEFQKQSQFIIITHSKRTMSMVDVLFGITMQTRGVSKKITVRFGDDIEEQTEAA